MITTLNLSLRAAGFSLFISSPLRVRQSSLNSSPVRGGRIKVGVVNLFFFTLYGIRYTLLTDRPILPITELIVIHYLLNTNDQRPTTNFILYLLLVFSRYTLLRLIIQVFLICSGKYMLSVCS